MISQHTTAEIFRKLREDPENRTCFDCNNIDVTHASINLGIMLCSSCASRHSPLGINISHIKSLKEPWTTRHLKLMTAGGNTSLKTFFAMYSIPLNFSDDLKYKTIACEYYREMLKMMADGDRIMMLTPSEEEGSMLMDEFREPDLMSEEKKEFEKEGYEKTLEKITDSETFTAIKGFTTDAFGFLKQGVKWGAEKGKEGLQWSTQQGKKLIRKMSNREVLMEEAQKMYSKLQLNLNFAKLKEDTLNMLREIEEKDSSE